MVLRSLVLSRMKEILQSSLVQLTKNFDIFSNYMLMKSISKSRWLRISLDYNCKAINLYSLYQILERKK